MVDRAVIEIITRYLALIPEEMGAQKAYLFGSYAMNRQREGSDIDVAVILDRMPDFFSAQRRLMRLRRTVDLRIEPHPLCLQDFDEGSPLALEIQKNGIEISW